MIAAYLATVRHGKNLDKIRQATREYSCKLSRSSGRLESGKTLLKVTLGKGLKPGVKSTVRTDKGFDHGRSEDTQIGICIQGFGKRLCPDVDLGIVPLRCGCQ